MTLLRDRSEPIPAPTRDGTLRVPMAAAASQGRVPKLRGGLPIVLGASSVGAIGSGSGEQDAAVAQAGSEAVLAACETPDLG
jgi:uncharacterized protein GlcG (DUF336 family)